MVVIRNSISTFEHHYGRKLLEELSSFADVIGYSVDVSDDEIRIELNPDRPDLMSFPTLVKAAGNFRNPRLKFSWKTDKKSVITLSEEALKLRPYVYAFTARGEAISDYFDDLIDFQEKVHLTVGKNRKKSSIGIHDFDKIKLPASFVARDSDSTVFTTYDGTVKGSASRILKEHPKGIEYGKLIPESATVPLIIDSEQDILSMPPVVNGRKSVLEQSTRNFFVDITGTDRNACLFSVFLMMNFFDSVGYRTELATVATRKPEYEILLMEIQHRKVSISEREVRELTGTRLSENRISEILGKMGFSASGNKFPLVIRIPPFRTDIMGPADILEDLAKGIGYDNIPVVKLSLGTSGERNRKVEFSEMVKEILIGAGFQEILTFVIGSESKYDSVTYTGGLKIMNPKSLEFSVVRDRLSLNMLELFQNNRNRSYPQNLFEVGDVIVYGKEKSRIALGIASSRASFSDIKRIVEYLMARLFGNSPALEHADNELLIPGRTAAIRLNDVQAGTMGEVRPEILERFSLRVPVALAELDVDSLYSLYYGKS